MSERELVLSTLIMRKHNGMRPQDVCQMMLDPVQENVSAFVWRENCIINFNKGFLNAFI